MQFSPDAGDEEDAKVFGHHIKVDELRGDPHPPARVQHRPAFGTIFGQAFAYAVAVHLE